MTSAPEPGRPYVGSPPTALSQLAHVLEVIALVFIPIAVISVPAILLGAFLGMGAAMTGEPASRLDPVARAYLVVVVTVVGSLLAVFKKAAQTTYGVIELCFGATTAWFGLAGMTVDQLQNFLLLTTSVYLTGRGAGNCLEGFQKLRTANRPLVRWVNSVSSRIRALNPYSG